MSKGTMFLLVGNSGSGKDSILAWAREHWSCPKKPLIVAQRYITRPESPETEKFISVTKEEFGKMDKNGDFLLEWISYDMHYGVKKEILDELERGSLVVVNVSRQIIDEARRRFPGTRVIFVQVPIDTIVKRIVDRGRESDEQVKARVQRAKENETLPGADFVVENTGTIEEGGKKLLSYLASFC
ncbi:MAG: dephospho-CoA kinase [Candidatus Lokiarchaeota archaeon]|nr:dephospho-CoA kinase [Candidatus Lokiarchaeota archaeon]